MSLRLSLRLSLLSLALASSVLGLAGCPTRATGGWDDDDFSDDDDDAGDDDDATGDPDASLSSGLYTVRSTFFTENDCGQDGDAFFPGALTLDVSGSTLTVVEFNASGTLAGGEFEVGRDYVSNYTPDGLECVLEIEVTLEGTVVADDTVDVVFEVAMDEAPLEPDADCEFIATTEWGFATWNDISGCRAEGTWTMER